MRHPNRPADFGSKERRVGFNSGGAVMPGKRTGYAFGGSVYGAAAPAIAAGGGASQLGQMAGMLDVMGRYQTGYGGQASGFDSDYYLKSHPDVAVASHQLNMDPHEGAYLHYNKIGRYTGWEPTDPNARNAAAATPAAAPQATLAGLAPVGSSVASGLAGGGGGAAPTFNANADLAAQQATGAATLAQMRGGNAPGALTAPAVAPTPKSTFTPTAGGNAAPPVAMAGGGAVEEMMPRQSVDPQSMIPPAGGGPALNRFGMHRGRTAMRRGYAGGGEVDGQTQSRAEDTYVTGDQLAGQVEERFAQALEADDKYRRNYNRGGKVDRYKDPLPEGILPPMTGYGGVAEGDMPRSYEEGGYVENYGTEYAGGESYNYDPEAERIRQEEEARQREAEEAAEADRQRQAEESEAAELRMQRADDETIHRAGGSRVGADDVGVEIPTEEQVPLAGTPDDEQAALALRQQQADADAVRAAGLDRAGAEIPVEEQVPIPDLPELPGDRQRSDEGTLIPPSEQAPYDGVDPAQDDDWLKQVLDYSHAKIDPAEIQPPAGAPAARTGYAPDDDNPAQRAQQNLLRDAEAMATRPDVTTSPSDSIVFRPPEAAPPAAPAAAAPPAAAPAAEPPGPRAGPTTSTAGLPELLGRSALKVGEKALNYFKPDPFEPQRPWGAVDDRSLQMSLARFVRGEGAFPPEQMLQMIKADENGDWNRSVQETFNSFKGDRESGFKFMQGLRPIYDNHIGFAQAAADAGRPDAVAKALERAHNFLPNDTYMKVDPAEGGYNVTLRSEKDPNAPPVAYALTNQQMSDFLKSNGSQFDSMAANSTAKNLDILTKYPGVAATRGDIPPDQAGDIPRTGYEGAAQASPPMTPEDLTPSMPPDRPYVAGPSAAATQAGADLERPYNALSTEQRVGAPTRTATGEQGEFFDPRADAYRRGAADRTIEPAIPNLYEKQARDDQAAASAERASRPAPGRRVGSVRDVMESNTMASPRSYNPGSLKGIYPKNDPMRGIDDGYYIPNAEQIDNGFVARPPGQNYGSKWEQAAHRQQTAKWNAAGRREADVGATGLPYGTYRDAEGTLRYGHYARAGESSNRNAPVEPATRRIGSPYASAGSGAEEEVVPNERAGGGGGQRGGARERPGDMVVHRSGFDPSGAPAFSSRQVGGPMLREQLGHPAFMDPNYRYPNDQQPIYPSRRADGTVITSQMAADARRDAPDHGYGGRAGRGPVGPDMRRADEESLRGMGFGPKDYVVRGPQGAGSIQEARSTTPLGPEWTPAYGRGQVAPPPPTSLNTPAARAARQYPGTTDYAARRTAEQTFQKQADEEGLEREKITGRENVARIGGDAKTTSAASTAQGRVSAAGIRADGTRDSASIRAASNERIASEREDGRRLDHSDKMEIARDNLEFMKSKAVADITSRIDNQATRSTMGAVTKKIETGAPLNRVEQEFYDNLLATARESGKRSPGTYIPLNGGPAPTAGPGPAAAPATAPAAPRTAAPADPAAAGAAVDQAARATAAGTPGATPPTGGAPQVRTSGRPQFGDRAEQQTIPPAAIKALRDNPDKFREMFDKKYGKGAADRILRGE